MTTWTRRWYGAWFLSALVHGALLLGLARLWPVTANPASSSFPELQVTIDRESLAAEDWRAPGRGPADVGPAPGIPFLAVPQSSRRSPALDNEPSTQTLSTREAAHGARADSDRAGTTPSNRGAKTPRPEEKPARTAPDDLAQDQEDLLGRSLQMARAQVVDPFAGKRVQALSSQTHDLIFGPYAEAWRQKVERVGALNYPAPVNGRELQGEVRLTVTLNQDGSIAILEVRQSSGIEALDAAAQHIVRMAAPFQPFTTAMRERADLITLTRTFHFIRAGETLEMH